MAAAPPTYDLMLLLDLSATDAVRAKIVSDTQSAIEREGRLVGHHDWGARPMAYQIERREQAEYHLFQFEGPGTLPTALSRTLRITDGVMRHRIIKLAPGTPPPPQPRAARPVAEPAAAAPAPAEAPAPAAPEPAAEPEAEAPVAPESAAATPEAAAPEAADAPAQ